MHNKYKYVVSIDGGLGPDVWDAEIAIEAHNIIEAATEATKIADQESGWVTGIIQDDATTLPIQKYDQAKWDALDKEMSELRED